MDSATGRMLPPDPEEMNERRAQWAADTLTFFEIHGEDASDATTEEERRTLLEQNLSDLIADFAHFCDRNGLEMKNVLRTAMTHYFEETDGVGDQFSQKISLVKQ